MWDARWWRRRRVVLGVDGRRRACWRRCVWRAGSASGMRTPRLAILLVSTADLLWAEMTVWAGWRGDLQRGAPEAAHQRGRVGCTLEKAIRVRECATVEPEPKLSARRARRRAPRSVHTHLARLKRSLSHMKLTPTSPTPASVACVLACSRAALPQALAQGRDKEGERRVS